MLQFKIVEGRKSRIWIGSPVTVRVKSGGDMKFGIRLQQLQSLVCRPQLLLAGWLGAYAATASARQNPPSLPEPSLLSLLGAAAVAGIIAYRIKKKK
jgi:hypothetical protein